MDVAQFQPWTALSGSLMYSLSTGPVLNGSNKSHSQTNGWICDSWELWLNVFQREQLC